MKGHYICYLCKSLGKFLRVYYLSSGQETENPRVFYIDPKLELVIGNILSPYIKPDTRKLSVKPINYEVK